MRTLQLTLFILLLATIPAYAQEEHHDKHENYDDHEGHDEHGDHDEHGHGEGADLDRPVEELMAQRCEHEMFAHECAECRYEVGMVMLDPQLFERGLLEWSTVREHAFGEALSLTGEIQFDERRIAHLGPRVTGVVSRVMVDLGEPVEAGQALIELESVELAESQSMYLQAHAEHRLANKTYSRLEELRREGISSQRDYLEAEREMESSRIRVHGARQRLVRLGMSPEEIESLAEQGIEGATGKLALTAPFAGEVLDFHAVLGERIEAGEQVLLLGKTENLWVWIDLYESQLAAAQRAMARGEVDAAINVDAFPGQVFDGQLDYLGRTMDETTRTVKGRVILENPEGLLRPGMFAQVQLALDRGGRGVAVPVESVLSDEGRSFVFVQQTEELAVRRPVTEGRRDEEWVEVLGELEPGQPVVSRGAFLLKSDVLRSKMGEGCAH